MNMRIGIILIGILLLAGCSSPTSTPPVETPSAPQAEQAASTPSAPPLPEPVEPHKRATVPAAAPAAKPKDVPAPVAPAPSEPPKQIDAVVPVPVDTGAPQPVPAPIPVPQPVPAPPQRTIRQVTIPQGTMISVRTSDPIDSSTAKVGQTFRAALDVPLTDGADTLAPRGADVELRVTHADSAGKLAGQSKLSLEVNRISVAGKFYSVSTEIYEKQAASQTQQTAKKTGIGAGIGALIGAIAGGGKGAAIGAGVGGGAGVAVEAAGKSQQVHIDSETRLDFRLQQSLEVTVESYAPATDSSSAYSDGGPRLVNPTTVAAGNDSTRHDLSGKWRISMDSPQGNRTMEMTLTQTGDQLQGTLDNRGRTESLKGTIHGNSFNFSTSADSTEQAAVLHFQGRISNDKLTGTMTRSSGGYSGGRGGRGGSGGRGGPQSVTWTADRDD